MSLVTYSSSSSSESECEPACPPLPNPNSKKRKSDTITPTRPPPLPPSLHSLYATNVRTSTTDDPSLHGGRKRQLAHTQGNWPTHAFLEWLPSTQELTHLTTLISRTDSLLTTNTGTSSASNTLTSFLHSPLSVQLPLHISLSAPLVLNGTTKSVFRDRFIDAVRAARIGVLEVSFRALDLVPNYERSRWFLILRVDGDGLEELLRIVNGVVRGFGLQELYVGGRNGVGVGFGKGDGEGGCVSSAFHISVAWTLDRPTEEMKVAVRGVDLGQLKDVCVRFEKVKLKIGNLVDDVLLCP